MRQFILPDLGEGLEEAEIVAWHVNEGDRVVVDQPLVSVETDKAVVEVPSPSSGRIAHLFGAKGDLVKVGAPLVEFAEGAQDDTGTVVGELGREEKSRSEAEASAEPTQARILQVLPAIRALARKLDVDLNLVQATGPGGMVTRVDVERAAKSLAEAGPAEPLRGMRRAMAQRMAAAHAEVARTTVTEELILTIGARATTSPSGLSVPSRQPARPSHRSTPGTMPSRRAPAHQTHRSRHRD
jgi:pyruvate dehydrogenase E2 component (dihydrolipoamide acetyltransferase)